jgi:hypothetical protein
VLILAAVVLRRRDNRSNQHNRGRRKTDEPEIPLPEEAPVQRHLKPFPKFVQNAMLHSRRNCVDALSSVFIFGLNGNEGAS